MSHVTSIVVEELADAVTLSGERAGTGEIQKLINSYDDYSNILPSTSVITVTSSLKGPAPSLV